VTDTLGDLLARVISAPPHGEDGDDAVAGRILDAALVQVAAVGVRRTTVDDVARRAVREARRFFAAIEAATGALDDPVERMVASFVTGLRLARGHPLLDRLARIEPETVLATLANDRPPVMSLARELVARPLRDAHRRGELRLEDADAVAEALLRLAVSFLLLPHSVIDLDDESATRTFAQRIIAPILRMNSR
jgi:AcrR family transcriptional regulator